MLDRILILIFIITQSTFAFSQWETRYVKVPAVECVNNDLYSIIDSIIELEKKYGDFNDSLSFIIEGKCMKVKS